jgi:hypothetical protein
MKPIILLGAVLTWGTLRAAEPAAEGAPSSAELPPITIRPGTASGPIKLPPPPSGSLPDVPPGKVVVGGAVPKLIRTDRPLQQINPFAPAAYGDGTDVLARDPLSGEARGVTLFSFTLPEKPNKKKAKKPAGSGKSATP